MSRKHGFTLVELLVVVGIVAILAGIIFPIFATVRRQAQTARCQTNLEQLGQALKSYHADNKQYPGPLNPIGDLLTGSTKIDESVQTCPLDPEENHSSYAPLYNYWGYMDENSAPHPITAQDYEAMVKKVVTDPTKRANCLKMADKLSDDLKARAVAREVYMPKNTADVRYWRQAELGWFPETEADVLDADQKFGIPDADFPGLANQAAPGNTIVTACPNHIRNNDKYEILRVSGDVEFVRPTDSGTFWTLGENGE